MLSKAHYTCLRQQEPWGVKKKKVANVEGITKALGMREGLGLYRRQKKGLKRLHSGNLDSVSNSQNLFFIRKDSKKKERWGHSAS